MPYRGSGDNNILGPATHDPVRQAGWNAGTVFRDPNAPPEQRYKLWSAIKVGEEGKSGLTGFCSPDGLLWTPCGNNPLPGHSDCLNVVFWDERIQQYVGYSRLWTADSRGDRYRAVRRLVSQDFEEWEDMGLVLAADEVDLALPVKRHRQSRQIMDFHGNCVFKYPGTSDAYLALPEVWWHWSTNPFPAAGRDQERMGGFPDTVDVQLATSRDGISWQRAGGRNPFLRLGPPDAGDSRMIYAFTQPVQSEMNCGYIMAVSAMESARESRSKEELTSAHDCDWTALYRPMPRMRAASWSLCRCAFAANGWLSTPTRALAAQSGFRSKTKAATRLKDTAWARPTK